MFIATVALTVAITAPASAGVARARMCLGHVVTIEGTAGDDRIAGTDGRDVIAARGGDDRVNAASGNDMICLGRGADRADGGDGVDVVLGGADDDRIDGGRGDDDLLGGGGDDRMVDTGAHDVDTMVGGEGNDYSSGAAFSFGGPGDDSLVGSPERGDVLNGGPGSDFVRGSSGDDDLASYRFDDIAVRATLSDSTGAGVALSDGRDQLFGIDSVEGTRFDDVLEGSSIENRLIGLAGSDEIRAGTGSDVLDGGPGDDTLDGGDGSDVASFSRSASGITADLRTGTASGDGDDALIAIEDLTGSTYDDSLTGDDLANRLVGSLGQNSLFGWGGDDYLETGVGDAGDGFDVCTNADAQGCERVGIAEVPSAAFVSTPSMGELLTPRRHLTLRGGISAGFGGLPRDARVVVAVRAMAPSGCRWWNADAGTFRRGSCGHPKWNARARQTWAMTISDVRPGSLEVCASFDFAPAYCAPEGFEPALVDFEVRARD